MSVDVGTLGDLTENHADDQRDHRRGVEDRDRLPLRGSTAGATSWAIAPPCDDAPTFATRLPSLTMTISGARWTVPTAAIAFIAANGSSAALGITGWGGGGGAMPGGGTTPPKGPFGRPAGALAFGVVAFFSPSRCLS